MRNLILLFTIGMLYTAQGQVAIANQNTTNSWEPKITVVEDKVDLDVYTHVYITGTSGNYAKKMRKGLKKTFKHPGSLLKLADELDRNAHTLYLQASVSIIGNTNFTISLTFKNYKGEIIYKIEGVNQGTGTLLEKFIL